MRCRRNCTTWLVLAIGVVCVRQPAVAGEDALQKKMAARVPLQEIPAGLREQVRQVIEQPTLFGQGPAEAFGGDPALYRWLLDHPDRAVLAWRRLGARCSTISVRPDGTFVWSDEHGSEIRWKTVYDKPALRIWYAEGKVNPALLPCIPVRIVVVLRHGERQDGNTQTLIYHQAHVFLQSDSRAAALVNRLLGSSVPRLAEQYVGQLEMFFSGLVWYLDHHPERSEKLLATSTQTGLRPEPVLYQARPVERGQ
jgi:hypothetical protein